MFNQIFQKIGLSASEAAILNFLFTKGENRASAIAKEINASRVLTYRDLEELEKKGFIEKKENKGQVTLFKPKNPRLIDDLLKENEEKIRSQRKSFSQSLPDLLSSFNLSSPGPKVKVMKKVEESPIVTFEDLNCEDEILSIIDSKKMRENKEMMRLNREYSKKRIEKKVKKKIIISFGAKRYFKNTDKEFAKYTQIKFLNKGFKFSQSSVQLYGKDNTSFYNVSKNQFLGVIIKDKGIYSLQKMLFEQLWNSLPEENRLL